MSQNPFEAPTIVADAVEGGNEFRADEDFGRAVKALQQTKLWARLLVMVVLVSGSIWLVISALAAGFTYFDGYPDPFVLLAGGLSMAGAVLYMGIGALLSRYASRIKDFQRERSMSTLATALEAQRTFWMTIGILALVLLALMLLFFTWSLVDELLYRY